MPIKKKQAQTVAKIWIDGSEQHNLLNPSSFIYIPPGLTFKLHDAHFASSVLCGFQNRQRPLLYTSLSEWFL